MRLHLQRVTEARVDVGGATVGAIGPGLLVLLGLAAGDTDAMFAPAMEKLVHLRIFADDAGNMNRSVTDVQGGILVVSQFTLYADCRKGRRPSFTGAMPPVEARGAYERFVAQLRQCYAAGSIAAGEFGAMMQVHLINDGPVTVLLDSRELGW